LAKVLGAGFGYLPPTSAIFGLLSDSIFGYGTDGSDFRPQNVVVGQRYSDDIRYHNAAEITKEPEDAPYGTGIPEIDSPDKAPPRVKPPPKPVVTDDGPKEDTREEAFAKRLALAKMELGANESKLYVRMKLGVLCLVCGVFPSTTGCFLSCYRLTSQRSVVPLEVNRAAFVLLSEYSRRPPISADYCIPGHDVGFCEGCVWLRATSRLSPRHSHQAVPDHPRARG
jgi:hypothetical protein